METCDFMLTPEEPSSRLVELQSNLARSYKIATSFNTELKEALKRNRELELDSENKNVEIMRLKADLQQHQLVIETLKKKNHGLRERCKNVEEKMNLAKKVKAERMQKATQTTEELQQKRNSDPKPGTSKASAEKEKPPAKSSPRADNSFGSKNNVSVIENLPAFKAFKDQFAVKKLVSSKDPAQVPPAARNLFDPKEPRPSLNTLEIEKLLDPKTSPPPKQPDPLKLPQAPKEDLAASKNQSKASKKAPLPTDSRKSTALEPSSTEVDKNKKIEKRLGDKLKQSSFLQQTVRVKPEPTSTVKRAAKSREAKIVDKENYKATKPGWLTNVKQTDTVPPKEAKVSPKKPPASPGRSLLNLSLTRPGRLRQTNMINFAKPAIDPDDTYCSDIEEDQPQTQRHISQKSGNAFRVRTVSAEDLFVEEDKDKEPHLQESEGFNTAIFEPAEAVTNSPKKRKSDETDGPRKVFARELSVIVLPTQRDPTIVIEDSLDQLEANFLSQPAAESQEMPTRELKIKQEATDVKANNNFDETYCPGFTYQDAQPLLAATPSPPQKKRLREDVQEQQEEEKDKKVEPGCASPPPVPERKKHFVKFTCRPCEEYYNKAHPYDLEHLQAMAKRCAEKHQRYNYENEDTPRGFWEIDFPPTQNIVEINKKNLKNWKDPSKK